MVTTRYGRCAKFGSSSTSWRPKTVTKPPVVAGLVTQLTWVAERPGGGRDSG